MMKAWSPSTTQLFHTHSQGPESSHKAVKRNRDSSTSVNRPYLSPLCKRKTPRCNSLRVNMWGMIYFLHIISHYHQVFRGFSIQAPKRSTRTANGNPFSIQEVNELVSSVFFIVSSFSLPPYWDGPQFVTSHFRDY